jgi:hypothetical protein
MQPNATAHLGACSHCAGEGEVITVEGDPLPLSLCPAGLALILARSSGIRRVAIFASASSGYLSEVLKSRDGR